MQLTLIFQTAESFHVSEILQKALNTTIPLFGNQSHKEMVVRACGGSWPPNSFNSSRMNWKAVRQTKSSLLTSLMSLQIAASMFSNASESLKV